MPQCAAHPGVTPCGTRAELADTGETGGGAETGPLQRLGNTGTAPSSKSSQGGLK